MCEPNTSIILIHGSYAGEVLPILVRCGQVVVDDAEVVIKMLVAGQATEVSLQLWTGDCRDRDGGRLRFLGDLGRVGKWRRSGLELAILTVAIHGEEWKCRE